MIIELNGLPDKLLSPNSRAHWSKKLDAKNQAINDVIALVKEQGWNQKPLERAVIRIAWGMPDKRARDLDNLLSSCKAHLDGLVHAGVIVDDSWQHVGIELWGFDSPKNPLTLIEVQKA